MEPRHRLVVECVLWFYLSLLSDGQRQIEQKNLHVLKREDLSKLTDSVILSTNQRLRSQLRSP